MGRDPREDRPVLHLHRSERTDALVEPLAQVLAAAPQDPFTPDVVAVPTRGVERWLAQRLSHHLGTGTDDDAGIAANIVFPSPGRLVDEVLAAVLGVEPDDDPWRPARLTWHVLSVIDACAHEPWCTALGRHLGVATDGGGPAGAAGAAGTVGTAGTVGPAGTAASSDDRRGRRLQSAQHLAALFASYAAQRPAMVRAWAQGRDDDGAGAPLPDDVRWQAELWRRVRAQVDAPSPAERLDDAVARLGADPALVDLPARLSVFGATRLPTDQLTVLRALADHRDVHLWLPHPSPTLWDAVAAEPPPTPRRRDLLLPAEHPLLASMARDATELQLRLLPLADAATHHPATMPASTLLGALQDRLRRDDAGPARHVLAAGDDSVRVHACHGRARQVEVLREAVVGLFDADPTLEPRDVVIMCPDVEEFAPLVTATFGAVADPGPGPDAPAPHPGRTLRVRLADRSLRRTNPLLELLSTLLELADARVTASDVVDLAASEPVRHRFGFDDDDLDRVRQWAVDAGARWGEDLARRERFGLAHVPHGTWDTALDRILLGAAMAEEGQRFVGPALPLDDVASTDIDLAGRLAELVDRVAVLLADLDGEHPADTWLDALGRGLDLLAATGPRDQWQEVQAREVLDDARDAAAGHGCTPLRLTDVRALLADRLRGRPTRTGFRTGALTVCSLEPMRAVPHRVVVLLGMDDGAFPRGSGTDGDDVLQRDPLVGERDRRTEDRQLFLDAVMSATDHLVVVHTGADERTGALTPPAVPVGELLDALDAAVTTDEGSVRDVVVVRHPLQPVDDRAFTPGALGTQGPFSYDAVAHRAARAAREPARAPEPFLAAPLAPDPDHAGDLDLDDLVAVLEHPVKAFLRRRLGVVLPSDAADLDDRIPLALGPLERWGVGDRLLAAALDGVDLDRAMQAEGRRGTVPPRHLGGAVLLDARSRVAPVLEALGDLATTPARTLDVTVALPTGRALTGTVPGVHGGVVVRAVYSKLAAKHRLRAWVQLLALTAARPGEPHRALTVGRAPTTAPRAAVAHHAAPHPEDAARWLEQLVALRDAALTEPLPLPVAAACAYARARHGGDVVEQALESATREFVAAYETHDDHLRRVWGEDVRLADLLTAPGVVEQRWWPQESTRFGALARRVWEPVLEHERTETR